MKILCVIMFVSTMVMSIGYPCSAVSADLARLQRGARTFMNYCAACHSLRYMRYAQMAEGIGLTIEAGSVDKSLLADNLVFTGVAIDEPIQNAMPQKDAKAWFGVAPPDLSLIVRQRGSAWLYTWLSSFYDDNSRPFGSNNRLTPFLTMPDVLSQLKTGPNKLNKEQFKCFLQDLVAFLDYVAEPEKAERYRLGRRILIFLIILLWLAWQLKNSYWRNR